MSIEIELHPVQAEILKVLLFKPAGRFRELNVTGIGNDHFTWHVKRLMELDLISKANGSYQLTAKGKEFANRMDTEAIKIERQAKTAVLVVCIRQGKGKVEYMLQERLKQPYYGYVGFLSGKIRWGELVLEAAARELKEETGLEGDLKIQGIKHKVDYDTEGKLLEDKFFYVVRAEGVKGNLVEKFEGGRNFWIARDKINDLPKLFVDVWMTIKMVEKRGIQLNEKRYVVEEY